jgi:hypothetical protein
MDNLRGLGAFGDDERYDGPVYTEYDNEDAAIEAPPAIGQDERRMQVRAYNFWTSQLGDHNYPNIEELDPSHVDDFRDYSVLLDFTSGTENPSIQYLGDKLREECVLPDDISYLDQVPPRSLLSRITDHYLQIIANRAPVGFEAEFVNDRGVNIMYRGILLPYSSDDDSIDFIYGVINWKEAANSVFAETLQLEVEDALADVAPHREHVPVWADGPAGGLLADPPSLADENNALDLTADYGDLDEQSSLADWLDAARSSANAAVDADVRSREALYRAIGRAYDFSLAAAHFPDDYAEILADSGLTVQDRAPMTPVVKLIFGAEYDKTRLTEFAAALDYASRNVVPQGALADLLSNYDGGLKAIVQAERRARKVQKGQHVAAVPSADPRLRLRSARVRDLAEFASGDEEFVILVARRGAGGNVAIVGTMADAALTDKVLAKTVV